jgi:hypothetical protein
MPSAQAVPCLSSFGFPREDERFKIFTAPLGRQNRFKTRDSEWQSRTKLIRGNRWVHASNSTIVVQGKRANRECGNRRAVWRPLRLAFAQTPSCASAVSSERSYRLAANADEIGIGKAGTWLRRAIPTRCVLLAVYRQRRGSMRAICIAALTAVLALGSTLAYADSIPTSDPVIKTGGAPGDGAPVRGTSVLSPAGLIVTSFSIFSSSEPVQTPVPVF